MSPDNYDNIVMIFYSITIFIYLIKQMQPLDLRSNTCDIIKGFLSEENTEKQKIQAKVSI